MKHSFTPRFIETTVPKKRFCQNHFKSINSWKKKKWKINELNGLWNSCRWLVGEWLIHSFACLLCWWCPGSRLIKPLASVIQWRTLSLVCTCAVIPLKRFRLDPYLNVRQNAKKKRIARVITSSLVKTSVSWIPEPRKRDLKILFLTGIGFTWRSHYEVRQKNKRLP